MATNLSADTAHNFTSTISSGGDWKAEERLAGDVDLGAYLVEAEPLYAALDLETTGLDPQTDRITHAAIWDNRGKGHVFAAKNEASLLEALDAHIAAAGYETLYTWNGEGFDLNFIRIRSLRNGVENGLRIAETGERSKYGTPRWDGDWQYPQGRTAHVDVSYLWQPWCEANGVRWKLKPLAEHFGLNPIELDTSDMSQYDDAEITDYVLSDVRVTLILAELWLAGEANLERPAA